MSDVQGVRLPPKKDERWTDLVTCGPSRPVRLLALKFMLTRMTQDVKRNRTPEMIVKSIDELHEFLSKNPRLVEADVAKLFG